MTKIEILGIIVYLYTAATQISIITEGVNNIQQQAVTTHQHQAQQTVRTPINMYQTPTTTDDTTTEPITTLTNTMTDTDEPNTTIINSNEEENTTSQSQKESMTVGLQMEQIGTIDEMIDRTTVSDKEIRIAQYGIHVNKVQDVTTHTTYIKTYIPLSLAGYANRVDNISIVINNTSEALQTSAEQLTEIITDRTGNTSQLADTSILCSNTPSFGMTSDQQLIACRARQAMNLIHTVQINTQEAFIEAVTKAQEIKRDIQQIEGWIPKMKSPTHRQHDKIRNVRDTKNSGWDGKDWNILGDTVASVFGLATYQEIGDIKMALWEQNHANQKSLAAVKDTSMVIDIHSLQIKHINTAVNQLQGIAGKIARQIRDNLNSQNIDQYLAILHTHQGTATAVFNKAHIALTDLNARINTIKDAFQAAVTRKLSIKVIDPATLGKLFKHIQQQLNSDQQLLWGIHTNDPTAYYTQITTNIEPGRENMIAMITFDIPIIDNQDKYTHHHITSLPFSIFQNQTTYRLKMQGLGSSTEILIPTAKTSNHLKYYQVLKQAIIKPHPKNIAATLKIRKLTTLNPLQTKCIKNIIENDIEEITKSCKLETTVIQQQMVRATPSIYTYFAKQPTTILVQCPNTPTFDETIRHNQVDKSIQIFNFGAVTIDPRCDVVTQKTRFIGEPIMLDKRMVQMKETKDHRFSNFLQLNISMWIKIINEHQITKMKEIKEVIQHIKSVTQEFEPGLLQAVEIELRDKIKVKITEAETASSKAWHAIRRIATSPDYLFAVQIIITIAVFALAIWTIRKFQIWPFSPKSQPIILKARTTNREYQDKANNRIHEICTTMKAQADQITLQQRLRTEQESQEEDTDNSTHELPLMEFHVSPENIKLQNRENRKREWYRNH